MKTADPTKLKQKKGNFEKQIHDVNTALRVALKTLLKFEITLFMIC